MIDEVQAKDVVMEQKPAAIEVVDEGLNIFLPVESDEEKVKETKVDE